MSLNAVAMVPNNTEFRFRRNTSGTLLVVCGALAKEVVYIIEHNKLDNIDVQCLSAQLHHRPALIPAALESVIKENKNKYKEIFVVYGDCGTAGGIDTVLEKYGVERIDGPHCFSFFHGNDTFMSNEGDTTSFFLTDFFCRHFDKFMWQQYGLDKGQGMVDFLFGNYKKLVFVAQTQDAELKEKAVEISKKLGLTFEYRYKGYGDLGEYVKSL